MSKLRLFFGIPIEEDKKNKIFEYLKKHNVFKRDYKWVPKENYHITLKFLGEVEEKLVKDLDKIGEEISLLFNSFVVHTNGFSGFPNKKKARVFFLDLKEKREIAKVFEVLENKVSKLNFKREDREYHPHITLARLRHPESIPELEPLEIELNIDRFSLYQSILKKEGSLYKILNIYFFNKKVF
ncbi:MAG: RNA 2',3'-cyclic phosphodiesterase [Candidatus Hydrothermales bacterium]